MDIQLNITATEDFKKKKKKQKSGDFNFVKKPSTGGTIVAKPKNRGLNKDRKINLSALKKTFQDIKKNATKIAPSSNDVEMNNPVPSIKSDQNDGQLKKKHDGQHFEKNPSLGDDLQMNFVSRPVKKLSGKKASGEHKNHYSEGTDDSSKYPHKRNFLHPDKHGETDDDLQMNFSSQSKKSYKKIQPHFDRNDSFDDNARNRQRKSFTHDEAFHKSNKVSVASLFRNNTEVPTVGQRAVLPLSEKLFSGELLADLNIHSHQVANLEQNLGLKELTTVQQRSSPIILQGRDTLVRSQTGSGKTLAYALPIIEALQAIRPKINRSDGIKVLVIVPTRELATQTYELFVKLVKPFIWIICGLLSGGQKRKSEKAHLRKGITILVATPGRLRDHLVNTRSLQFENVRCLVLDEADRLLDMGYEKDVSAVIKAMEDHKKAAQYKPLDIVKKALGKYEEPPESTKCVDEIVKHKLTAIFKSDQRQTILLSATLTKGVEKLAGLTMVEPVFVDALEGRKPVIADSLATKPAVKIGAPLKTDKIINSPEETPKDSNDSGDSSDDSDDDSKESGGSVNSDDNDDNNEELLGLKAWNGQSQRNLLDLPEITNNHNKVGSDDSNEVNSEEDSSSESESECMGLAPWNGQQHSLLFDLPEVININKKILPINLKSPSTSGENSDSESDYEFFKMQKKSADIKSEQIASKMDEANDNVTGNLFRDAINQAIEDEDLVIPESVNQTFIVVPMKLRLVILTSIIVDECLVQRKNGKILIFMATQELVDFHCKLFERVLTVPDEDGGKDSDLIFPVELNFFQLHGSMEHSTRMKVFKQFREAKSGVLICTDVAARGLDLPQVDTVIQYTLPSSAADYVHRVGRTGRAGRPGRAILILLPEEVPLLTLLADRRIRICQEDGEPLLRMLSKKASPRAPGLRVLPCSQADRERAARLHNAFEDLVASTDAWTESASKAFVSWSRQYRTYPRSLRSLVGNMHLGHACRALAIKELPREAAAKAKAAIESQEGKKLSQRLRFDEPDKANGNQKSRKQFKKTLENFSLPRRREFSEFDSGLEPISEKKKIKS